jgi:hypothetical protein
VIVLHGAPVTSHDPTIIPASDTTMPLPDEPGSGIGYAWLPAMADPFAYFLLEVLVTRNT